MKGLPNIAFITSFLMIIVCSEPDTTIKASSADFKDNLMHKAKISIIRDGEKLLHLEADKLEQTSNEEALLTDSVFAIFYREQITGSSRLYSDSARLHEREDRFMAFGKVRVESDSGLTLLSQRLFWDPREKLIVADSSITFWSNLQDTLYGNRFESDPDLQNWSIESPSGVMYRDL